MLQVVASLFDLFPTNVTRKLGLHSTFEVKVTNQVSFLLVGGIASGTRKSSVVIGWIFTAAISFV